MSLARPAMSAPSLSSSSSTSAGARGGVLTTLKATVLDFRRKSAARQQAHAAVAALAALDDAALADMGISRGQIEDSVVNGKR